jgi:orotidine-5'-phosphate decarboxylase
MNANVGLLINSSRGIIYASSGTDFAEKARAEALKMQQEMEQFYLKCLTFKFSMIKISF